MSTTKRLLPIYHDGTSRRELTRPELESGYFAVEERNTEYWLKEAWEWAEKLPFFSGDRNETATWDKFLDVLERGADGRDDNIAALQEFLQTGEHQERIAASAYSHRLLFLEFLEGLDKLREKSPDLTRKHIHHYYENLLKFSHRAPGEDSTYVFLTLKEGEAPLLIEKGARMTAEVESEEDLRFYETQEEAVINHARPGLLHRVNPVWFRGAETNLKSNFCMVQTLDATETFSEISIFTPYLFDAWDEIKTEASSELLGPAFYLQTPVLDLSGGTRNIDLFFSLMDGGESTFREDLKKDTAIEYKSSEGWLPMTLREEDPEPDGSPLLLSISADAPSFDVIEPEIRIRALEKEGTESHADSLFSSKIEGLDLGVKVVHDIIPGDESWLLSTSETVLANEDAWEIFGSEPQKDRSSFYFSRVDMGLQPLTEITISFDWVGFPDSLESYYADYIGFDVGDFAPEVELRRHQPGLDQLLGTKALQLVSNNRNSMTFSMTPDVQKFAVDGEAWDFTADPRDTPVYYSLRLTKQDFMHDIYAASQLEANQVDPDLGEDIPILNPPYTPLIRDVQITYTYETRTASRNMGVPANLDMQAELPLRKMPIPSPGTNEKGEFSGAFNLFQALDQKSQLVVDIHDLQAKENLNLYFHGASGVYSNVNLKPSLFNLVGEERYELEAGAVYRDLTLGLRQPGNLIYGPEETTVEQTDTLRLGFEVEQSPTDDYQSYLNFMTLSEVRTQALEVKRTRDDNEDEDEIDAEAVTLAANLSPGLIQAFEDSRPEVDEILQPYASFGGSLEENDSAFRSRVSRYIGHKNRALRGVDYEAILLDAFPEIYKVKYTPEYINFQLGAENLKDIKQVPGHLKLVVIPDFRSSSHYDPLKPRFSVGDLERFQSYISELAPPDLHLEVINPDYKEVEFRMVVLFKPGLDQGYYSRKIQEELRRYLAPWAYSDREDISFTTLIRYAGIVNHISRLDFVEAAAHLKLSEEVGEEAVSAAALSLRPETILVPAEKHDLSVLDSIEDYRAEEYQGIGYMKIEGDYYVFSREVLG